MSAAGRSPTRSRGGRLGPRSPARRRSERSRSRPSTRCSPRPSAAPTRSPSATPATSASSTAPASPRRCTSSATCRRSSAAPAPTRPALLDRHRRPGARRAASSACRRRARAIETKLLFFELEWAALDDERADELLATEGLDFCRHHLRHGAALPPAPAERARGEDPRREGADRPQRLGPAVRGADRGAPGRRSRTAPSRSRSRSRSRTCTPATAPSARTPPSA